MPDNPELAAIILTFLLAGTVKGVLGLGLPTVSLALLTLLADLPTAMTLMLLPSLVTNLWQGFSGRDTQRALTRFWPLLTTAGLAVALGGILFNQLHVKWLTALLGVLIIFYALISLSGIKPSINSAHEKPVGFAAGLLNGILTGLTGSSVVPGVMYLQALDMPRPMFMQSMGLLFSVATVGLAITLWFNGLLSPSLTHLALWAVVAALIGMPIGQWLGKHIPDNHFRRLFFVSIAVIGAFILIGVVSA